MSFSVAALRALLEAQVPAGATGLVVALSGGADSAGLLAAAVQADAVPRCLPLRAVHIDHGLQAGAAEFSRACTDLCERLRVPLSVIRVRVDDGDGVSIEAAAREARYAALAAGLGADECLLTAHHCEDQAETLLLQALRGAGLRGLASMPARRRLGAGWHLRPLLGVSRRELLAFGASAGVAGVTDPMNEDLSYDRAYLRGRIWPLLEARWPGAGAALSRTARHAAEAQDLLDFAAAADLSRLRDGDALSVSRLRALELPRQVNALRCWIAAAPASLPPAARLTEALRQILDSAGDHQPAVIWGDHALRRYRDRLFLTAANPPRLDAVHEWAPVPDRVLELGTGLGRLRWVAENGGLDVRRLPARLSVARRRGGEELKPAPAAATQTVQHLCQAQGVLPWLRDALPLIFAGDELIAVADLWSDARWRAGADERGLACVWDGAPNLV
jgi:tRNA(Ile)-lysidine synthase